MAFHLRALALLAALVAAVAVPWPPTLNATQITTMQDAITSAFGLSATYGAVCGITCPNAHNFGQLIRIPFHDATGGTEIDRVAPGGANGCLDFTTSENNGMLEAITTLRSLHTARFSAELSFADFLVLAGNTAVSE